MQVGSYMCTTHALKLEGSDDISGEFLSVRQCDAHHSVRLCSSRRPILHGNKWCCSLLIPSIGLPGRIWLEPSPLAWSTWQLLSFVVPKPFARSPRESQAAVPKQRIIFLSLVTNECYQANRSAIRVQARYLSLSQFCFDIQSGFPGSRRAWPTCSRPMDKTQTEDGQISVLR